MRTRIRLCAVGIPAIAERDGRFYCLPEGVFIVVDELVSHNTASASSVLSTDVARTS